MTRSISLQLLPIPPRTVKTALLVLLALVVGAIVGVGFLAAFAKFGFDVAKHVFNVAFQASGCLIRSIALIAFLYLLYLGYASLVGG